MNEGRMLKLNLNYNLIENVKNNFILLNYTKLINIGLEEMNNYSTNT